MLSVLYVDDELALLELGKLFLERTLEFRVDVASSAVDALTSPAFPSYDAIISDYQMPEMDGIAFLKIVRERFGDVPFILFTGRGREDVVIEAINNGVDFYLQKGGDVKAQFAELSHKIRQAVARRQAEHSLRESEKRFSDIIEFLPDATLAINREGAIIAWNREIEEMTGLSAEKMLGKRDYEYALPFYGERRPILIDLIFEPDNVIEENYSHIRREKDVLIADTTLPRLNGRVVTLVGKASPLFDSHGEIIGAIEAIRDITEQKRAEDELRAAYEQITASEEELREQLDVLAESEQQVKESASRLEFMLGFYERANEDEKGLLSYAVEGAGIITGSPLGYLAFLNDDESELTMYAWSKNAMEECSLREKPIIYKTEKTGLWGEAVRQRRAVITNDYAAPNPAKKGYPTGHPEIVRHMNIPVIDAGHIVMVAGVANQSQDYTDDDAKQLSLLMQGLWQVIKQRQTKQELAESEEKYRDLFENSVIGIFRTTPEGKLSAINTTYARISGYASPAEMLAEVHDIRTQLYVHGEDRDRFLTAMSTEGFVKNFEVQFYHRDGHPVWTNLNANTIRAADGEIKFFEGTIEDIDEMRKIEQAFHKEKMFSDTVMDSIPGLLYLYDNEGRLVRWNKSHETITGYTAAELAGMNVLDWFRGDDVAIATITDGVSRALKEGEATAEANLLTKSGKKIPFFFTAKRLEMEGKTYFIGVGIDITDRLQAQDEIREREATLASIFRAAPVGIGLVSNRVLLKANDRLCEMTGYSAEELIGRSARILYPDDEEFDRVGRDKYELIRKSGTGTVETRWQRKDGAIRDVLLSSTPLDPENPATGVTFTALDMTERKSAEEELRSAHEHLTASEEDIRVQFKELTAAQEKLQKSQQQLEEIAGTVPGVVYQFYARQDGRWGMYYVSSRAEEIFGLDDRTQDFFSWFTGRVDPCDREGFLQSVNEAVKTGRPWNYEGRFIKPSGERIWFQGISSPIARQGELVYSGVLLDITQRKLAEEAIRNSEAALHDKSAMLEALFNAIPDVLGVQDIHHGIIRYNAAGYAMVGKNPGQVAGRKCFELIGHDTPCETCATSETYRTKKPAMVQKYVPEINAWLDVRSYPVLDDSGNLQFIIEHLRDISGQKRAEEMIREKTEEINQYFATSIDLITIADAEGCFRRLNPEWEKTLGYTLAELEGKRLIDFVHPDDMQVTLAAVASLSSQKGEINFTNRYRHKDGTYRWLEWQALSKGSLIYAAARDITDRKQSEDAIRERDVWARTILNTAQAGIIIIDAKTHQILDANPAALDMIGQPRDSVIGMVCHRFICPTEEGRCPVTDCGKNINTSERVLLAPSGAKIPVLKTVVPVSMGGRNVLVESFVDISEQKRAEDSLREANHKLNLLNSMTRHDVANQLTILQGYAQIAAMKKGDPVISDYLAKIIAAADSISRQIEFTRMYQELGVKAPAWTQVEKILAHVESRIPITFSGTCRGIEIFADPMLERVFFNLIDNAIRHGGRVREITVRCEREPDGILIIVEDNGIGVPATDKEKIFERGVGKNTGLGLFLVRDILSITGISIKENGVYGKGARFEISVPERMYRLVTTQERGTS